MWDGGGVGECAAITGYVRTATECSGQCVLFPIATAGVFPDLSACVACGCDPSKIRVPGLVGKPVVGPGDYCGALVAMTTLPRLLDEAFPGYDGGCYPVAAAAWACTLLAPSSHGDAGWSVFLDDAGYARTCAATLVPRVTEVQCVPGG